MTAPHFVDGSDPQVATFGSPWVYYRCRKPDRLASGVGLFRGARDHARGVRSAQGTVERAGGQHGVPRDLLSLGMELPVFPALSRERPAPDRHRQAFLGQDRRHRPALRARRSPLRLPGAGGRHHRGRDRRLPEHPGAPGAPSRPGRRGRARLSARKERAVGCHRHLPALLARSHDIPRRQRRPVPHRLVGARPDPDAGRRAPAQGGARRREYPPAPPDPQPPEDAAATWLHAPRRLPRHQPVLAGLHVAASPCVAHQPTQHAARPQVLREP